MSCDPFMEDTRRFEAAAYDHGFRQARDAQAFDDLDEALVYAAQHAHENGRVTSFTGRNRQDIRWLVRDKETSALLAPRDQHIEAARLLAGPSVERAA